MAAAYRVERAGYPWDTFGVILNYWFLLIYFFFKNHTYSVVSQGKGQQGEGEIRKRAIRGRGKLANLHGEDKLADVVDDRHQ